MFTPEELEDMRRFDAEVDARPLSLEDLRLSSELDRIVKNTKPRKTPEKDLACKQKYRAENREKELARVRQYNAEHRKERCAYQRAYYAANKDRILAKARARRKEKTRNQAGAT